MSAQPDSLRTTIQPSTEVRNRVRSLKRGQESSDDLLRKMAEQYEPSAEAVAGES